MKHGQTEVETCQLNGWGIGTIIRGHEEWAGGAGTWTTMRITGLGETMVLGRGILRERTQDGVIVSTDNRIDGEHSWTLQARDWVEVADPTATPAPSAEGQRASGGEGGVRHG